MRDNTPPPTDTQLSRPLGKLVKLRARVRSAIATLKSAVNEQPPKRCNTNGCGAEPAWAMYILTVTPEGHRIEGYVFCRECELVHTGQKHPAIVRPDSTIIVPK